MYIVTQSCPSILHFLLKKDKERTSIFRNTCSTKEIIVRNLAGTKGMPWKRGKTESQTW